MGAWGIGIFEDDAALDFLDDFDEIDNHKKFFTSAIKQALQLDYLEFEDGIDVLVCASFIDINVNNTKIDIIEEDYQHILPTLKSLDLSSLKEMVSKALKKVISEQSELNELWSDSELYDEWKANIEALISRLT